MIIRFKTRDKRWKAKVGKGARSWWWWHCTKTAKVFIELAGKVGYTNRVRWINSLEEKVEQRGNEKVQCIAEIQLYCNALEKSENKKTGLREGTLKQERYHT